MTAIRVLIVDDHPVVRDGLRGIFTGDPDFEGRLQDEVAGLSGKAADAVRGLSAAAPALQRSLAEVMRNLDAALGGLGR